MVVATRFTALREEVHLRCPVEEVPDLYAADGCAFVEGRAPAICADGFSRSIPFENTRGVADYSPRVYIHANNARAVNHMAYLKATGMALPMKVQKQASPKV
jgi:hypothetical protein